MCNDYEQHVAWAEYCKMMQALELGMPTQQSELDLNFRLASGEWRAQCGNRRSA